MLCPTGFTLQGNRNRVTGLRYDAHGNILSLQRFDAAAEKTDDFSYDYLPHTNRLGAIAGHAAYSYNDLGQLTGMYDRPEGAALQLARNASLSVCFPCNEQGTLHGDGDGIESGIESGGGSQYHRRDEPIPARGQYR